MKTHDEALERYLNDHLAGSSGALLLIDEIASRHSDPEAKDFFHRLKEKVEEDRALLEELLSRIGKGSSGVLKAAGGLAARVGGLKLKWEKIEDGELGMFEALEMLAVGIQGKRLLWLALGEIAPWFPEWTGIRFADLELEAIRQRDGVERWRVEEATSSLIASERKAAAAD